MRKNKNNNKSKTNKLKIVVAVVLILAIAAAVAAIMYFNTRPSDKKELCEYSWKPYSAENASGDEVEMAEVYNTKYSSYQGSLEFAADDTFAFWMTPGVADDGTHSGTYSIEDDGTISMTFDDGTLTSFETERADGKINAVIVYYDEYKVKFEKNITENTY